SDINAFKMLLERHGCLTLTQLESFYNKIQMKLKGKKNKTAHLLIESYIQECLQLNKAPTWKDNENYFLQLFQIQESSRILDPDSISIDRVLPPWFETYVKTKY